MKSTECFRRILRARTSSNGARRVLPRSLLARALVAAALLLAAWPALAALPRDAQLEHLTPNGFVLRQLRQAPQLQQQPQQLEEQNSQPLAQPPLAQPPPPQQPLPEPDAGGLPFERHHLLHHHASYRYLLNRRQRQRGISYYGSADRLRAALSRALTSKQFTVGVVGGSISAGTGAEDAPPWADRLQTYLAESFTRLASVNVTVNNGAVPGTTSAYMAACAYTHVPRGADLVVVEYSINDDWGAAPLLDNAVRRPYERLLRKLLSLPSRPAVVLLHAYAWLRQDPGQGLYYSNAERELNELAGYYNLPSLSVKGCCFQAMRDGVDGFQVMAPRSDDPAGLRGRAFYWDAIHPDGLTGHRVMAELVISLLQRGIADLLHSPLSPEDAVAAASPLPPPMLPGNYELWTWVNEAPSLRPKWGYIADQPGAALRLRVNTTASAGARGARVLVQLAHLRSYEHMGRGSVTCESGCNCSESEFSGHTETRTSLLALHSFYVSQADECVLMVTVMDGTDSPTGEHKVKLAAVVVSEEAGEGWGRGVDNAAAVEHVHDISFRHEGWGAGDVFDVRNHI